MCWCWLCSVWSAKKNKFWIKNFNFITRACRSYVTVRNRFPNFWSMWKPLLTAFIKVLKGIYIYFKFAIFVMHFVNSKMKFKKKLQNAILNSNNSQNWKYCWCFLNFLFCKEIERENALITYNTFPYLIFIYLYL